MKFNNLTIGQCFRSTVKKTYSPSRALRLIGRRWSLFPKALSQTPVFTLRDYGYGASVTRGVPVYVPAVKPVPNYTAWWQRHMCVWTTCLRSLPGSVPVRSRTCAREWPQDYKSDTLPLDYRATQSADTFLSIPLPPWRLRHLVLSVSPDHIEFSGETCFNDLLEIDALSFRFRLKEAVLVTVVDLAYLGLVDAHHWL